MLSPARRIVDSLPSLSRFVSAALSAMLICILCPNPMSLAQETTRSRVHIRVKEISSDILAREFDVELSEAHIVTLTCESTRGKHELHRLQSTRARNHQLILRGLKAATPYRCFAFYVQRLGIGTQTISSPFVTFQTASLPYDLKAPVITVPTTDLARTGYILYSYGVLRYPWRIDNRYQVILDAEGNVRWYFASEGGGDVDTTWIAPDAILYGGYASYSVPPTMVGLDKTIRLKDVSPAEGDYESRKSWNHDTGISEDGSSLFYLTGESNGTYHGFFIRQLDLETNQIVWTWSSFEDGMEMGELPPGSEENSDPYHANAIDDQWEDRRLYLYVGLRDQNQVIKIDYETGEVLWHLGVGGDFQLLEKNGAPASNSRWFFDPHDIKFYGPNRMSVHDNGTDRATYGGKNFSRALQLDVDQVSKVARIRYEYTEANWVEPIWGGYDLLPTGNGLLCLAHCWLGAPERVSSLIELSPDAKVAWRADFTNDAEHAYRAERIDGCELFNNVEYCRP